MVQQASTMIGHIESKDPPLAALTLLQAGTKMVMHCNCNCPRTSAVSDSTQGRPEGSGARWELELVIILLACKD